MISFWQKVLVQPTTTIREALEKINSETLRMSIVVDSDGNLLGVLTDGDVRRGLLKGILLDDPVVKVMNSKPVTAQEGISRNELIEMMKTQNLLSIPILKESKVIGLETLHGAMSNVVKKSNPIFIMAGGFGTRLRPLTDDCPKPMLKVGNKPMLEILVERFKKAGFFNIYISTHFMPDTIMEYFGDGQKHGVNITYVHEPEPLGTGGALGLLPDGTCDELPLVLINGDVLTNLDFSDLLEYHKKNSATATICVKEYEYQIPYGVIEGDGLRITSMKEKPVQKYFVNAGVYVLEPEVVNSVVKGCYIDAPTVVEEYIEKRSNVFMFPIHEYWLDIGRVEDFKRAQFDYESAAFR